MTNPLFDVGLQGASSQDSDDDPLAHLSPDEINAAIEEYLRR